MPLGRFSVLTWLAPSGFIDNRLTALHVKGVDMADKLNSILESGGTVVVSTQLKAVQYGKKHAGWFSTGKDGNLYVNHGKGKNCLTADGGKMLLVKIIAYK